MEKPYNLKRPAGLEDYVITHADVTYLIFSKKEETVYCTRCRKLTKTREAEWMEHKGKALCPHCGQEGETLNKRYGRKGITEYGRVLWFRKHGRITFAQLDEYDIDYTGVKPVVSFWTSAQYRLCKESQRFFKHTPEGWWHYEYWSEKKRVYLPAPPMPRCFYAAIPKYEKTLTHDSLFTGLGTDLQYANLDMTRFGRISPENPYALISYFDAFLKYQAIELLEKAGFEDMVKIKAFWGSCGGANWKKTDLRSILGLNNYEIKEFRKYGGEADVLRMYKTAKKYGRRITFEEAKEIMSKYTHFEAELRYICKVTHPYLALAYIQKQGSGSPHRLSDYRDYLKECSKLGYDLKNKKVLFPEDLQAEHARTSMEVKIADDMHHQEEFKRQTEKLYGKPEFSADGLLVRAAEAIDELHKESLQLHHCVRTYVDKVCRGDCAILFIRKTEAPDEPYYTMEINKKGEVVQCRGLNNRSMTEEVEAFVELWKQNVMTKSKKRKEAA